LHLKGPLLPGIVSTDEYLPYVRQHGQSASLPSSFELGFEARTVLIGTDGSVLDMHTVTSITGGGMFGLLLYLMPGG
jgi:hypothetical protein